MAKKGQKHSTLFPHSWFMALEKLPDDVAGRIYKAVHRLDITGEKTIFEEGTIEYILFEQYSFQTSSFKESYAEECKNRSEAAKAREARKAQQSTKENLVAQAVPDRSGGDVSGMDMNGMDVSGGGVSGEDDSDTTTTTDLQKAIVDTWNSHDFVQKIKRVDSPQKRWERTEMAIAVAGGKKEFLHQLRTLDEHAYLKNQPEQGYKVIYDWLTAPENFQSFLEGRYKDARGDAKKYEGWEVVEFG